MRAPSRLSTSATSWYERLWSVVTRLASIPLLPHWKTPVIKAISSVGMVLRMGQQGNEDVHPTLSAPIGNFIVMKVRLDQERLAKLVTSMVRRRVLTLQDDEETTTTGLGHTQGRIGHQGDIDADSAAAKATA